MLIIKNVNQDTETTLKLDKSEEVKVRLGPTAATPVPECKTAYAYGFLELYYWRAIEELSLTNKC